MQSHSHRLAGLLWGGRLPGCVHREPTGCSSRRCPVRTGHWMSLLLQTYIVNRAFVQQHLKKMLIQSFGTNLQVCHSEIWVTALNV